MAQPLHKTTIRNHIAAGNTKRAFRLLLSHTGHKEGEGLHDEIVHLSNRFQRYLQAKRQGLIPREVQETEINQINQALLELLEQVPERVYKTRNPSHKILAIVAILIVVSILLLSGGFSSFFNWMGPDPDDPSKEKVPVHLISEAGIAIEKNPVDLGRIYTNTGRSFKITLLNKSMIDAHDISVLNSSEDLVLLTGKKFDLPAGNSKTLRFTYQAGTKPQMINEKVKITGGNFDFPFIEIPVIGKTFNRTAALKCPVEEGVVSVSFQTGGNNYIFLDSLGFFYYEFPESLFGKTIEVTFTSRTGELIKENIPFRRDRCFTIPGFDH